MRDEGEKGTEREAKSPLGHFQRRTRTARERLFDRAEAESQSQQSAIWRRRRREDGRSKKEREGGRKGRLRDRPSPEMSRKPIGKRGEFVRLSLCLTLMRKT